MAFKQWCKGMVKKELAMLGLQFLPKNSMAIPAEQFAALITAYEHLLKERWNEADIPPSQLRVDLLAQLLGTSIPQAFFIVRALASTRQVTGDVCEFGVAQGATSALIANEIRHTAKQLHLFDSFAGLPRPGEKDHLQNDISKLGDIQAYAGTMACPEDMVRAKLAAIDFPQDRQVVHRGFVEQVLAEEENLPTCVSFAYVDMDFYGPIMTALTYLDRVTPAGAQMIVDDYDYFSSGAKTAVDEFLADKAPPGRYTLSVPDKSFGCFAILQRLR